MENTRFNTSDYIMLVELIKKFQKEGQRIFNLLRDADTVNKTEILRWDESSVFEKVDLYECTNDTAVFRYHQEYYDKYFAMEIEIPFDIFGDDVKINEWIKSLIESKLKHKKLCKQNKND